MSNGANRKADSGAAYARKNDGLRRRTYVRATPVVARLTLQQVSHSLSKGPLLRTRLRRFGMEHVQLADFAEQAAEAATGLAALRGIALQETVEV